MNHLAINNVSCAYQHRRKSGSVEALHDVTFSVEHGEFVAIVGPSGCGKSSLLNLVAGLQSVQQGEILLNGKRIEGPGRERAMVFQSPALLPWRTVLGNVAYGLEMQGVSQKQAIDRAKCFINLVGLSGFAESFPSELSGGMQQRVNLARALTVEPTLLLMDEPLSALDAIMRENMQVELQRIWLESKQSVLYVTHQIDEAVFLADRVVVISSQPGSVRKIVSVPLSRPRDLSAKRQPQFSRICEEIWQTLQIN